MFPMQPFFEDKPTDPVESLRTEIYLLGDPETDLQARIDRANELRTLAAATPDLHECIALQVDAAGEELFALGLFSRICARDRALRGLDATQPPNPNNSY